jgi:limonene-1,2-epoxide hydrolase
MVGPSRADAVAVYMRALDSGDTAAAVEVFAPGAEYVRSAVYDHEEGAQVAHGHNEIAALFERRKGKPTRHIITWQSADGFSRFGEGVLTHATTDEVLRRFLFRAETDSEGRITRYVAGLA